MVKAGRFIPTTDFRGPRQGRHDQHLRPHAAQQDEGPGRLLHRRRGRAGRAAPAARASSSSSSRTTYPGHDRRADPARCSTRAGLQGRQGLLPRLLARARRSGQRAVPDAQHPQGRRRRHPALHRGRVRALPADARDGRPGLVDPRGRDGEAAREHVPQRQHRAGQRDRAPVRAPGHRRVGSHRRRGDEAVRLHALLPGTGPRRALHPDRSVLPVVEGASVSGFEARFIELAGEINGHMPEHVVRRVVEALNEHGRAVKGSRILVLGVAYKADIDDTRESPSLDIIELLEEMGARVDYADPLVPAHRLRRSHAPLGPAVEGHGLALRLRGGGDGARRVRLRPAARARARGGRHAQRAQGQEQPEDRPAVGRAGKRKSPPLEPWRVDPYTEGRGVLPREPRT